MYIPDLELCNYHSGPFDANNWSVPLLAIGWLEHPHPYNRGPVPPEFLNRFAEFIQLAGKAFSHYRFRGLHQCSLCQAHGGEATLLRESSLNLFVPGSGVVYVATASMSHYMQFHSYTPPGGFIESMLRCPEPGTPSYKQAIMDANGGHEPPLQPDRPFRRTYPKPETKA